MCNRVPHSFDMLNMSDGRIDPTTYTMLYILVCLVYMETIIKNVMNSPIHTTSSSSPISTPLTHVLQSIRSKIKIKV